ncbi:MAG TPA: ATP-binding protein [Gammaproteobacteria bacterium]|jgi:signal transduction histidine kinase/ActR/RegA family two-component response regulator|nr:ATP-binding protein [Gammaproteobacteria bacterium]
MINKPQNEQSKLAELEEKIKRLEEKQEEYNTIIASLPGNVYWKNLKGEMRGCNANVVTLFGLSSLDEVIGRRYDELFPDFDPHLAAEIDLLDAEIIRGGTEQTIEEHGFDDSAQPATYLSKKIPFRNKRGEVAGLLGVSFNITDRKKMEVDLKIAKEKAEAANQAKSQFLTILNHELRTPLTSILGLINFLNKDSEIAHRNKKTVHDIQECATHLLGLINYILDFSKVESGQFTTTNRNVAFTPMIQSIHRLLLPIAEQKKLSLTLHVDPGLPDYIFTDELILKQIFINLINNAIKFTHTGGITFEVRLLEKDPDKAICQFNVIDTGIGISQSNFEKIFEPFSQVDNSYSQTSSRVGTGLGLSIVRNLVHAVNSTIEVKSELDQGSTFSVTGAFQITAAPEPIIEEIIPEPPTNIYPSILSEQPIILLVEDSPIIQFIHRKMLEDLGCSVEVADTGQKALDSTMHYDLMLVDIGLPDMNGFDLMKRMRAQEKTRDIPIIALTAYDGTQEKTMAMSAGATAFAIKPIPERELGILLAKHLSHLQKKLA